MWQPFIYALRVTGLSFNILLVNKYQKKAKESPHSHNEYFNTCEQGARHTCILNIKCDSCTTNTY